MIEVLQPPGSKSERKIPIRLLILDAIGTVFLVLGLLLLFGVGSNVLGDEIDPNQAGMALIVVGIVFIVPLVVHVLKLGQIGSSSSVREDNRLGPGS